MPIFAFPVQAFGLPFRLHKLAALRPQGDPIHLTFCTDYCRVGFLSFDFRAAAEMLSLALWLFPLPVLIDRHVPEYPHVFGALSPQVIRAALHILLNCFRTRPGPFSSWRCCFAKRRCRARSGSSRAYFLFLVYPHLNRGHKYLSCKVGFVQPPKVWAQFPLFYSFDISDKAKSFSPPVMTASGWLGVGFFFVTTIFDFRRRFFLLCSFPPCELPPNHSS